MFIGFLAPGAGLASGSLAKATAQTAAAGTASGFAAGLVGGLVAPIFDLLFPAPTAVATIDGLPPEFLEDETSTDIPPVLFTYNSSQEPVLGPPPFSGGQSPGVLYNVTYTSYSANLTTCIPFQFDTTDLNLVGPIVGLDQSELLETTSPGQGGSNTTGERRAIKIIYDGGAQITPQQSSNWFTGCGTNDRVEITNIVRADGNPDTGGDPPPEVLEPARPNLDSNPEVIPPPVEFPQINPDPNISPEPQSPLFNQPSSDLIILPSPVEIGTPDQLPEIGTEPPPEIEFAPPLAPPIPLPIPIITTPTIPEPFLIPFPVPIIENEDPPGEVAELDPIPEIIDEEVPTEFPPLPFPGLLTPEGQILIKLEECCLENQQTQEECCEEILDCLEEIKEKLDEIDYQVNPPPPGDPSLQLKTSTSGEEVLVSGETDVIWIRIIYDTLPNLNKRITASNPVLTALWGSFLNYIVSGKFSTYIMITHTDNFFQAPKRCTGFGLFFKHGASGRAEYYVRIPD